jgi:hypothetical protein
MIELKELPKNFVEYIELPHTIESEIGIGNWIHIMLGMATSNFHISRCRLTTVEQNEPFAIEKKYVVHFRKDAETSASPEFFFEKFPEHKSL